MHDKIFENNISLDIYDFDINYILLTDLYFDAKK